MADAQFAIDIAAQMPAGEQTIAELDAITAKLNGGGRNAETFQKALAQVSAQLDAAKAASVSANEALSAGEAEYRALEKAADRAAKAAERAAQKNGGVVPPELAAQVAAADVAVEHYADSLRDLEKRAQEAGDAQSRLSKTQANLGKLNKHVTDRLGDAATKLSTFRGALGDVGGPLGEFGEKLLFPVQAFVDLNEWFGKSAATAVVAAVGFAAVAAGLVALSAAAVVATVKTAAWAVGLADAARRASLAREALEALHPELAGVRGDIDALEDSTGVGAGRLREIAIALKDAKVGAAELPAALKAAATAEAALGQGGANQFIADIKDGKLAVDEFATNARQKFGGIVGRQMLGLDEQMARLKRNIGETFGGLDIDPLLESLKVLVDLFDENTASGRTMKFLFETVFQPIIDGAAKAIVVVEAFALGLAIGLVKAYLAAKPAIRAIEDFFGFDDGSLTGVLASAKSAGELVAPVLVAIAAALAGVTAAVGVAVGLFGLMVSGWGAMIAAAARVFSAVTGFVGGAIASVIKLLQGTDLASLGRNLIEGLARGVTSAAGAIVGAVKGAVDGAINAAKAALGIASPSKVFAMFGAQTGEGFVDGVDGMAGDVRSALADMVEPPDMPSLGFGALAGGAANDSGATAGGASGGAGASGGVSIRDNTFNFYGVKDAQHGAELVSESLTRLIEGDAASLGGSEAA